MKSDTITTARLPELAATNWGPGVPCGGARSRRCCIRNLIFAVRPAGAHRARPLLSSLPATLRGDLSKRARSDRIVELTVGLELRAACLQGRGRPDAANSLVGAKTGCLSESPGVPTFLVRVPVS